MKLYFVRHGKTTWNLEGRLQGASGDSPLLKESFSQIKALGQRLRLIPFDAVYSSDLKRAIKTAQILVEEHTHDLTIKESPLLREWQLGRLEGQKISLIDSIYTEQMTAFRQNLARFRGQDFDAETVPEAVGRLKDFLTPLQDTSYQHVLIVGHGAHLSAAIRNLLGYERSELRSGGFLDNASLTILETIDFKHYQLKLWNDTSKKGLL